MISVTSTLDDGEQRSATPLPHSKCCLLEDVLPPPSTKKTPFFTLWGRSEADLRSTSLGPRRVSIGEAALSWKLDASSRAVNGNSNVCIFRLRLELEGEDRERIRSGTLKP